MPFQKHDFNIYFTTVTNSDSEIQVVDILNPETCLLPVSILVIYYYILFDSPEFTFGVLDLSLLAPYTIHIK